MGKYAVQQKHLRANYSRLAIDLKPDVLNEFKRICSDNDTTATTEVKRFIAEYCERYNIK